MSAGKAVISRRRFLIMAAAGLLAACSRSDDQAATGLAEESAAAPAWLPKLIGDQAAAARIGKVYLDLRPGYRSIDTLTTDIERSMVNYDAAAVDLDDTDRVASVLHRLVRHEYAVADVTSVDGWVLSTTEARIYALTALAS
ncbi:MAG: hypothetical protein RQ736_04635 [Thiogranum sp.]|nr:hypothetical protein [Thiogranum sp.]